MDTVHPATVHQLDGQTDAVDIDDVAGDGQPAEPVCDQTPEGLVGVVQRQPHADGLHNLVNAEQTGQQPCSVLTPLRVRAHPVVLVHHIADELLDQILDGDQTVRSAELVDDNRQLQAAAAQGLQQRVEFHRGRYDQMINHDVADGHRFPVLLPDRNGVLDVDETDDVVETLADHRKTGVPGPAGHDDDLADRVVDLDGTHPDPGSQDVRRLLAPERQRTLEQRRGLRRECALFRGPTHQGEQLLRGSGRGELLLGLDAHPTQQAVGGSVEEADRVAGHAAEASREPLYRASGGQRTGNRQILRHQLAIDHRCGRGERQGDRPADAPDRSPGYAEGFQWPVEDARDRRFGEETDRQIGDGDPQLRSGQLGRKIREGRQDTGRPPVTRVGSARHA